MSNRFNLPNLGIGLGLRTVHYAHILEQRPPVAWFEILSENFMQTEGKPLYFLDAIAERYPIVMHGVSLSIGSCDPLDRAYLAELKLLRDRTRARWVSDHLCWTGSVDGTYTHDLLPMPYTFGSARRTAEKIKQIRDYLEVPICVENVSSYAEFHASEMTEWEFLSEVVELADCGILLDVNNIYVSAKNHGFDPITYLDAVPWERVVQFHVAGHTDHGTHIVDTHIGPVADPVWRLFGEAYRRSAGAAVLLEWDAEIPSFEETYADALRARDFVGGTL